MWADTVSGPLPRNEVEKSHGAEGLKKSSPLFDHSVAGETNCQHITDTLIDYNCIYFSGQVIICFSSLFFHSQSLEPGLACTVLLALFQAIFDQTHLDGATKHISMFKPTLKHSSDKALQTASSPVYLCANW